MVRRLQELIKEMIIPFFILHLFIKYSEGTRREAGVYGQE